MTLTETDRSRAFIKDGVLQWPALVIIFMLSALLVFTRRPDVLLNAQFYAEDGAVWYADAYNLGWLHSLTLPAGGYLNTLQRLVAGVALLVPLRHAPLIMNIFGIIIQVLPAWFLLTKRCADWGSLPLRVILALLYLAIPNSREVHVVLTNAHFHFALLAFLIALASPPLNWRWRIFDVLMLLINGLSGPFGIILLPLLIAFWYIRRQRWSLILAAIVIPTVLIQLAELRFGGYALRAAGGQLGATPLLFARIFAGQVCIAAFIGENNFAVHAHALAANFAALAGAAVFLYCLLKGPMQLKLFLLFALALFAASLARPLVASATPQWEVLTTVPSMRYWFFPMLALLWCFAWMCVQKSEPLQMFGVLALLTATIGIHNNWRYPPYKDEQFQRYVSQFNAAPPGATVDIPVFPDGVVMELRKKTQ